MFNIKMFQSKEGASCLRTTLEQMLDLLNDRQRDVIISRYNLDGKGIKTLDSVGKKYGITRERVRQIESEALNKLRGFCEHNDFGEVLQVVKEYVIKYGGVVSENFLIILFFNDTVDLDQNRSMVSLILDLDRSIHKSKENFITHKFYFCDKNDVLRFRKIIAGLEKYFLQNKQVISFDNLKKVVHQNILMNETDISDDALESYLNATKVILMNIMGEWGYYKWPDVYPRSVRDKSYLALKKVGKPLHFTKITSSINNFWPNKRRITNFQTVHNELIKDKRFVLIGRGIYALKEWGYRPGVVLDVIIEIMKLSPQTTLSQEEVIQEVLKRRQVKRNTIILNLQNREFFEKLPDKMYRLK